MDPRDLRHQFSDDQLRALARSARRYGKAYARGAARRREAQRYSAMTPEQEEFWLGETRATTIARCEQGVRASAATARAAAAALRM